MVSFVSGPVIVLLNCCVNCIKFLSNVCFVYFSILLEVDEVTKCLLSQCYEAIDNNTSEVKQQ